MELRIMEKTPVFLTEEEAKRFISFQKHYALIGLLESVGAFNIRSGDLTIHFNALGKISGLEKREFFKP